MRALDHGLEKDSPIYPAPRSHKVPSACMLSILYRDEVKVLLVVVVVVDFLLANAGYTLQYNQPHFVPDFCLRTHLLS